MKDALEQARRFVDGAEERARLAEWSEQSVEGHALDDAGDAHGVVGAALGVEARLEATRAQLGHEPLPQLRRPWWRLPARIIEREVTAKRHAMTHAIPPATVRSKFMEICV